MITALLPSLLVESSIDELSVGTGAGLLFSTELSLSSFGVFKKVSLLFWLVSFSDFFSSTVGSLPMLGVVFCGKIEIMPNLSRAKILRQITAMIIMIVANICFFESLFFVIFRFMLF